MTATLTAPKIETSPKTDRFAADDHSMTDFPDLPDGLPANMKRFTADECEKLEELGILPERYELIYGVIYLKMPMNPPHRIALRLFFEWLVSVFGLPFVLKEDPITIPGEDGKILQPEPDIAVTFEPTTSYIETNPTPSDILLVVEVADSTLTTDTKTKAAMYASVNIPEYLVLDVGGRQIFQHRVPVDGIYTEIVILSENESLTLLDRTETIRVGELCPSV